jgi:hypothetical protein
MAPRFARALIRPDSRSVRTGVFRRPIEAAFSRNREKGSAPFPRARYGMHTSLSGYFLGPLCLIRARRQCRARFAGCSLRSQTLTPARGSGRWFPWSLLREAGPAGRLRPAKAMETTSPHRDGAVTAKRAKRSGAAAKRLDGDGPMWPPDTERCAHTVARARGEGGGELRFRLFATRSSGENLTLGSPVADGRNRPRLCENSPQNFK